MTNGIFALDLKAFADKTSEKARQAVSLIVLNVGRSLILKSPVGDPTYWQSSPPPGYVGGRFRANWQYSIGSINYTTTEKVDPSGQGSISNIVGKISSAKASNVHYITNSLPYGNRLEFEGWSRQVPNGMVRLTVAEFQPIVNDAARAVQ